MSVADNIAVVPKLLGWPKPRINSRIDELLQLVDLEPAEFRQRRPAQLSGDPEFLLMDEPSGALDAINRSALQGEIIKLQAKLQKTILFVSHDVEEALRLADRILIMRQGQVVQYDVPWKILTQPCNDFVKTLMGGDDVVRCLGLLKVGSLMEPPPVDYLPQPSPSLHSSDHIRHALSLFLGYGVDRLPVIEGDRLVGILTWHQIRCYSQELFCGSG